MYKNNRMKTLLRLVSRTILFFWGWDILGTMPRFSKAIILVAPHRKGFPDVVLGWLVQNIQHIPNKRFLAKYEALQIPIGGWILKKLGAIPVDRNREFSGFPKGYYVDEMVKMINQEKEVSLVIAPEGTRNNVPWKTGFHKIAMETGIPVVCVCFDYVRKRVVISHAFVLTGNLNFDLCAISGWYIKNVPGYVPQLIQ